MIDVVLALNPLDPETVTRHSVENLFEFLSSQFPKFPENAKIYHGCVAELNDVTPCDDGDIETLEELPGPFIVVCQPGDPLTISLVAVAIAVALTAYTLLSIPNSTIRNTQSSSPNNSLSERTNQARPQARIPDIVGTLRATPDDIQVPYRIFNSKSEELELSYMCVTRGYIDVTANNVFDGDTQINQINGESVEIYAPFTSPNSGDAPQLRIGETIATGIIEVQKSNSINGQTLYPPNYKTLGTECSDIYFTYDSTNDIGILNLGSSSYDFTKYFELGDQVVITGSSKTVSGHSLNFDGTYIIGNYIGASNPAVQNHTMRLLNASTVKTDWITLGGGTTTNGSGPIVDAYLVDTLTGLSASKWIGPFNLTDPNLTGLLNNFVAVNGIYKVDNNGGNYVTFPITIEIGVTPIDQYGVATGGEVLTSFIMPSSAVDTSQKALSAIVSVTGRVAVRAHRVTLADYTYNGQVIDTIQWRDLYGTAPVPQTHFGNVTTIQTLTRVTPASLGVKSRKINLICTRKLPARIGTTSTFGALTATNNAADIICALALDPYIGNRSISEIDVSGIYAALADNVSYFGIPETGQFSYTFDKSNLSFEETISTIAGTVFCTAYREGRVLKLTFEKQTSDSTILFNHRNVIPGSEQRDVRFGLPNNTDGIEYTYVNPIDETVATIYIPEDQSALQPKKIESVGIRNIPQAYLQAHRAWNKMQFQNTSTSFTATREADLIITTDRILKSDETRPDTQDGEILSQNVLTLQLSQLFNYTTLNHVIFLQLYDGTIQAIPIASADPSPAEFITLGAAPNLPLVLTDDRFAVTTYEIVGNSAARNNAFLTASKTPQDRGTVQVTAINYDDRYYQNDLDYINGVTDENGMLVRALDGSIVTSL